MPAQYPGMGYVADSPVVLARKIVNNTALIAANGGTGGVTWVAAPATAASAGTAGQIAYDGSYLFVCVSANTWVKTPLATW